MINVVDLFAGPGGLSLGFDMVKDKNGKCVYNLLKAVEYDPVACQTLRTNFGKESVIEGDLRDEKIKQIIEKECAGKTDIVVAGPPCQSFSLIGPRSGNDTKKDKYKYDNLYREFVDVIDRISPKFFVFENVKGILSKRNGDGRVIDIIISDLKSLGYNLTSENKRVKTDYIVINAADYGIPQTRERVFIIGNNTGAKNPFPNATHYDPLVSKSPSCKLYPYVSVFDAIGDLPNVRPRKTLTGISANRIHHIEKYNKRVHSGKEETEYKPEWKKKHLSKIGVSGRDFHNFVRPKLDIPLTHHIPRPQMESDILLFKGMRQGMIAKDVIESRDPKIKKLVKYIKYDMSSFSDKYKKQVWKRPSSTIFAHMQKDGNRFIHPDSSQARSFTPREAARIQSFPDDFFFEGTLNRKFQQIGNAVPPLLANKIAKKIAITIDRNI